MKLNRINHVPIERGRKVFPVCLKNIDTERIGEELRVSDSWMWEAVNSIPKTKEDVELLDPPPRSDIEKRIVELFLGFFEKKRFYNRSVRALLEEFKIHSRSDAVSMFNRLRQAGGIGARTALLFVMFLTPKAN